MVYIYFCQPCQDGKISCKKGKADKRKTTLKLMDAVTKGLKVEVGLWLYFQDGVLSCQSRFLVWSRKCSLFSKAINPSHSKSSKTVLYFLLIFSSFYLKTRKPKNSLYLPIIWYKSNPFWYNIMINDPKRPICTHIELFTKYTKHYGIRNIFGIFKVSRALELPYHLSINSSNQRICRA